MSKNSKLDNTLIYDSAFSSISEEDFGKENSGYLIGLKNAIAQIKDLRSQNDELRSKIDSKDEKINNLIIANGIYSSTTLINIVGVIMTTIGGAGVGLAFRAPLTDAKWAWWIAGLSLLFSITGVSLPLIIRLIGSCAARKKSS